jgi:hypothetical protein
MSRVLFTWELGGGFGHLHRVAELARPLVAAGHEVHFASAELAGLDGLFDAAVRCHQAPLAHRPVAGKPPVLFTFPQVLMRTVLRDVDATLGAVRAWQTLFDLVAPDVIVADYSPTALLAARGRAVRQVVVGTGFLVPPDRTPLDNLRRAPAVDPASLQRIEARTLETMNDVLRRTGGPPLERVGQLYAVDAQALMTLPELDHYAPRDGADYWGLNQHPPGAAPDWPDVPGKRVFAYLKPFKTLPALLETMHARGGPTLVFAPKLPAKLTDRFASPALRFVPRALEMDRACREADLVICHAGHGAVASALLAGTPLLALPQNLEQHLNAENAARTGAALNAPRMQPGGMATKFGRLLDEPSFTAAARDFAARHAALDPGEPARRLGALIAGWERPRGRRRTH